MQSTAHAPHVHADGFQAGCDYITAFWNERDAERFPEALATEFIHGEESRGCERAARSHQGIDWYGAGQCYIGVREGERFYRASGAVARDSWERVTGTHTSISRADWCFTSCLREPRAGEALASFSRWKALPPAAGQPTKARYFVDQDDGETFALGSRTSDVYLRLYDWGVAHNAAPAGCRWRYEAELKGDRATRSVALLRAADQRELAIAALVRTLFTDRRVDFPANFPRLHIEMEPRLPSTFDKKLLWLSRQVKPAVQKLVEGGKLEEVLEAIGLAEYVSINPPK